MKLSSESGGTAGRVIYRQWKLPGLEYRSDLIGGDYMRRWVIRTILGTIRLHHILRGDSDRDFHDHPMSFLSIIIFGGYIEYRPSGIRKRFLPGSIVIRKAEDLHRLQLLKKSAWTLVFALPVRRKWGFMTEDGWIVAGEYDAWKNKKGLA